MTDAPPPATEPASESQAETIRRLIERVEALEARHPPDAAEAPPRVTRRAAITTGGAIAAGGAAVVIATPGAAAADDGGAVLIGQTNTGTAETTLVSTSSGTSGRALVLQQNQASNVDPVFQAGHAGLGAGIVSLCANPANADDAVEALQNGTGRAILATAVSGTSIRATSTSGRAIDAESTSNIGVVGTSTTSTGVVGFSTDSIGTSGASTNSTGVDGTSVNGYGVAGTGDTTVGVRGNTTTGAAFSASVAGAGTHLTMNPTGAAPSSGGTPGSLHAATDGGLYFRGTDEWSRLDAQGPVFLDQPQRAYDGRPNRVPDNDAPGPKGRLTGATKTVTIDLTVAGGIPSGARGALVNLTIVDPLNSSGYCSVYAGDVATMDPPPFSHINWFGVGQVLANTTSTKLSPTGTIKVFASSPTHVIVDVLAYWS